MFIDHIALKKFFSSRGAQCARIAQTFRSSRAFKFEVVPQFYKHFVPLGLKTSTENQNFLYIATTLETTTLVAQSTAFSGR